MKENLILARIEEHARVRGESTALRDDRGSINYSQLLTAVEDFSRALSHQGIRRIILDAENSISWAIADLAAMSAEATVIPLPGFFSKEQVTHVAQTTAADLVLVSSERLERWSQDGAWTTGADARGLTQLTPTSGVAKPHDGIPLASKITFTSGSSGKPKGVVLDNGSITATSTAIVNALAPVTPREHIAVLPLATLLENIAGLYAPLMNGSSVYLPAESRIGLTGASLDTQKFCELLNGSGADTMILVPQLLTAVVTLIELNLLALPSFRLIAVGGGRISRTLLDRATAVGLPVCEGYGLSECCSVLTLNLPGQQRPGSVGRPLDHARLRISDTGEIEVLKPVMSGYLEGNVLHSPDTWYQTGDLGHLDNDGYLHIDGRSRNVFITAYGRNVNPEWPEAALQQHAVVAQAMMIGEGRDHNLALLWLRFPQSAEEVQGLVQSANSELPDYAQIHKWVVVETDLDPALQTDNGRLRRHRALQHYAPLIDTHYANHSDNFFDSHSERTDHAVL
ncbi:AMP-binding protein [Congregibacter sp.]|uniref:AMP-binding protein n=1 Tax=Congregibacter sp. TaxID=2744308 RepID=UPI003F6AA6A4